MSDEFLVNGNQVSWGSAILKLDGDRYSGITGFTVADKRERVKGYGMGRHHAPRSRSRGKYTVEPVKVTFWKASAQIFRMALAARSDDGRSYGDVEFEFVSEYIDTGDLPMIVQATRCVWAGNSSSDEEQPDPLKEEVEFDAMCIYRNGLVLFDGSEGIL